MVIATESLRATVHQPLWLEWHYRNNEGEWLPLVNDRPTSAYLLNAHGDGVAHYQSRRKDERFYGLGDKAGDLQRNGKRYEMRNLDAMGYNAVVLTRCTNTFHSPSPAAMTLASACFMTTSAAAGWIWETRSTTTTHAYRRWRAEAGDIDYYLFTGERVLISPKPSYA